MKLTLTAVMLSTAITLVFPQSQAAALSTVEAEKGIPEASKLYMEAVPLATDSLKRAQLLNQAEKILTGIIEQNPESLEAYRKLLGVYLLKQDYTNGIQTIKKAITLSPEDPKLLITLAFLYEHSGEFEYAKAMLDEALILDPSNKLAKEYKVSIQKKLDALLQQAAGVHEGMQMPKGAAHP